MTYKEALKKGYKKTDLVYALGYVSRKANVENLEVKTSKKGRKYVLLPNWNSTRFCFKQYLGV